MNVNALTYELAIRQIEETVTLAERNWARREAQAQHQTAATFGAGAVRRLVGGAMIATGRRVHGQAPAAVGRATLGAAR